MRQTWATFAIACLAIAGFPLTAGFFSKDEILWKTFSSGHTLLYVLAVLTALMTAAYSFRILLLAFHGTSRLPEYARRRLHESPATMTIPLWVLAGGALAAGWLNLPAPFLHFLGIHGEAGVAGSFLAPIVEPAQKILLAHAGEIHAEHGAGLEWGLMSLSILVALAGIGLAVHFCLKVWPNGAARLAERLGILYQISYHRWWWDDFYNVMIAANLRRLAWLADWFDRTIIDGALHGIGAAAGAGSRILRALQNGQVQAYALAILLGVNIIVWLVLWL
jgi:NADH-quinone oxidoreductase subunit L